MGFCSALFKKVYNLKIIATKLNTTNILRRYLSIYPSIHAPIKQVINENETIQVKFCNGTIHSYPWIFLQDNCTCSKCYHTSSQSRTKLMINLDLNKKIEKVNIVHMDNDDTNGIKCIWCDGHEGIFTEKWLFDRRFTKNNIEERIQVLRDDVELIDANYIIQRDNFNDVLQEPLKLLRLLKILSKYGIFILEGASKQIGQLRKLVNKIGFIRTTHYGNEFTVKSERNPSNLAYTSERLCVHTDLPYYVYPPGIQFLHCIQQYKYDDDGGHTNLVDGFYIAQQMKQDFINDYNILGQIYIEFSDIGKDFIKFNKIHHSPTFVYSKNSKKLERIVYSNQQLSSFLPIPMDQVKPFYNALKLFTTLCYESKNLIRFKLNEGDVLIFDNWRILHGREGFDSSKGERHLEGCYMDWDEIYSTIRVLENERT